MKMDDSIQRRDFLKVLLGGFTMAALDWTVLPTGAGADNDPDQFDAIIIGSGIGGLSCAAAFARQGFKPLVIEMHTKPGGYATTFKRPGGFVFDVSLHSTVIGERDGIHNLMPGFPQIEDVQFVPHPHLYRAIFPEHDFRVPQRNVDKYMQILTNYFPGEEAGIKGIIDDMRGVTEDISKYISSQGEVDMNQFSVNFPHLFKFAFQTWGQVVDSHTQNARLKALVSALWGYYGLPPSKLASIYYGMPTIGYLEQGGYYPIGRSQKISDAFVKFIEANGGKVLLGTRVERILTKDHTAYGVRTGDSKEYKAKVVVSNANSFDTFRKMMDEEEYLQDYLTMMDGHSVSLSSFQVFLGLKKDLVGELGVTDSEIFIETGYDSDKSYNQLLTADVENSGYGVMIYDNLYEGYSPTGKNTLNILVLQGYDHWKRYEADYWNGNKKDYKAEKERMADILIARLEEKLLPGLAQAVEVKDTGSPLTNVRYTGNYRGAMYGWDQTMSNSGQSRVPHNTPIKNLYLAGAWTKPGHGYGGVLYSGLECFGEIMSTW
jgi:phytoene dehydrogenase-like protein